MAESIYTGYCGTTKGIVIDTNDPKGLERIQVYIPSYHGGYNTTKKDDYPWATMAFPYPRWDLKYNIKVNDIVLLAFEGSDIRHPVYLGLLGATALNNIDSTSDTVNIPTAATKKTTASISYAGGSVMSMSSDLVYRNNSASSIKKASINGSSVKTEICIGKCGWQGNQARDLIKEINALDPNIVKSIENRYHVSFGLNNDWSGFCPSADAPFYSALTELLESDSSQRVQDTRSKKIISTYVNKAIDLGITDPEAILYFCDLASQNIDEAAKIVNACNNSDSGESIKVTGMNNDGSKIYSSTQKTLSAIYNETLAGGYYLGSHTPATIDGDIIVYNDERRKESYNIIQDMVMNGDFKLKNKALSSTSSVQFEAVYPVNKKFKVTLPFGYDVCHRNDLMGYEYIYHEGVDISGNGICGASVYASHDGILHAGTNAEYGNYFTITYKNFIVLCAHLSGFVESIDQLNNTFIKEGTKLGYVGFTGNAVGAHLHFGISDNNGETFVDPEPYFVYREDIL